MTYDQQVSEIIKTLQLDMKKVLCYLDSDMQLNYEIRTFLNNEGEETTYLRIEYGSCDVVFLEEKCNTLGNKEIYKVVPYICSFFEEQELSNDDLERCEYNLAANVVSTMLRESFKN